MFLTILATIGVLGVLILVHELGHFLAARAFDIQVTRFSIGLGPRLFGFQRGETDYRISALPLGGYVKLAGMEEMELLEGGADQDVVVDPERTFAAQPASVRAVVLSAGVAMNALLAVILFAVIGVTWGRPVPSEPVVGSVVDEWLPDGAHALADLAPGTRILRVGGRDVATMDHVSRAIMAARAGDLTFQLDRGEPVTIRIPRRAADRQMLPLAIQPVSHAEPIVGDVSADGPAADAGLQRGDRVLAIDGTAVTTWQQLAQAVRDNPGRDLTLHVQRGDERFAATLTPAARPLGDLEVGHMGAARHPEAATARPRDRMGPVQATRYGFAQSWDIVTLIGGFITGMFDGRHSARELGGPIMIAQFSGAASRAGFPTLLFFTALLSINLAVINLLPIPVLDGGHLALLGIEAVRGRPPSERARAVLGRVGLAVVFGIMAWAVTADILRVLGI